MDPNGILQRVDYVSDPLNGYKVLSEPMIKDTPEVAKAKADFFKAYQEALNVNLNWVLVLILSIYQVKYIKNMSPNKKWDLQYGLRTSDEIKNTLNGTFEEWKSMYQGFRMYLN